MEVPQFSPPRSRGGRITASPWEGTCWTSPTTWPSSRGRTRSFPGRPRPRWDEAGPRRHATRSMRREAPHSTNVELASRSYYCHIRRIYIVHVLFMPVGTITDPLLGRGRACCPPPPSPSLASLPWQTYPSKRNPTPGFEVRDRPRASKVRTLRLSIFFNFPEPLGIINQTAGVFQLPHPRSFPDRVSHSMTKIFTRV